MQAEDERPEEPTPHSAVILIVPTVRIKKYLESGDLSCLETVKDKLHVAVTRAFHSVAFVYDGSSEVVRNRWMPSES